MNEIKTLVYALVSMENIDADNIRLANNGIVYAPIVFSEMLTCWESTMKSYICEQSNLQFIPGTKFHIVMDMKDYHQNRQRNNSCIKGIAIEWNGKIVNPDSNILDYSEADKDEKDYLNDMYEDFVTEIGDTVKEKINNELLNNLQGIRSKDVIESTTYFHMRMENNNPINYIIGDWYNRDHIEWIDLLNDGKFYVALN